MVSDSLTRFTFSQLNGNPMNCVSIATKCSTKDEHLPTFLRALGGFSIIRFSFCLTLQWAEHGLALPMKRQPFRSRCSSTMFGCISVPLLGVTSVPNRGNLDILAIWVAL